MQARILAALVVSFIGLITLFALHFRLRRERARGLQESVVESVVTWIARLLLAIGLATIMLTGFTLLFIRSELGGRDACALAQAVIEDVAHQQVSIRHCMLDPVGARVVINDIRVGPRDRVLFAADRLAAGLDQQGIFAGKIKIDRIDIDRPRVQMDFSAPSPKRAAKKRPPGAACLPDLSNLQIGRLTIRDGSFHALLPDEQGLALEGLGVSVTGDGDQLKIDLKATQTTLADAAGATTATKTDLEGSFDFVKGTAQVERLEISGAEGSLKANGALASICAAQGHASAQLDLDFGLLHNHLLRKIPNLAGKAQVEAAVQFQGENFDARVKADVQDSEVLDFEPGTFSIEATATPKRLSIAKMDVPMENGHVVANGTVDLTPPFDLDASATLDGFSLGEVLERIGVPGLPVHVAGSGTASIEGPLVTADGFDLDGSVDLEVKEFGVYDRSWRRRKSAVRFAGFTNGTLKSDYHLTPHQVDLENTRVSTRGSDIDVEGTVYFDVSKGLDLKVEAPRIAVADIGPFAGVAIQGIGDLRGTIVGPYRGLDIRGDTQLGGARVIGYSLGDVTGSVDLDLLNGTLTATNVQGEKGDSTYSGNGVMRFHHGVTMEARARLDSARLSDLLEIAHANYPVLDRISREADATLTGDVELSGSASHPTIETQLKLAALNAWGQRFDTGVLRARMREAREVEVTSLQLRRGAAEVNANGWYRFADKAYRLKAASKRLRVADVDALVQAAPTLKGTLAFNVAGEGRLAHPQATGQIKLRNWYLGDQPVATAALDLSLDGKALTLNGEAVSPWPAGSQAPVQMPDEPLPRPPGSMSEGVNATILMADEWPYTFEGKFSVPDASVLMRPGTMTGISAGGSGKLTASGMLLRPMATTSAVLELDHLGATVDGKTVETLEPVHAVYRNGILTFNSFPVGGSLHINMDASGTWTLVNAEGKLDLGGPKNFALTGDVDLSLLKNRYPALLDDAKGHLGVALDVRAGERTSGHKAIGEVGEVLASINGTADLRDVTLRPKSSVPMDLSGGNGTLSGRFLISRLPDGTIGVAENDGLISVDRVEARINETGRMSMNGEVHADQRTLRDGTLTMQIDDVPLRLADDMTVLLDGRPELVRRAIVQRDDSGDESRGPDQWENILGGSVEVKRFRYTRDLEPEHAVASLLDFSRRPPAPRVFDKKAGDVLKFDVGITFDDVQVINNIIKAKFDASNLRLKGTSSRPGLTGSVGIAEAKAHVYNADFVVSSGVLNFTDPSNMFSPVIALRADAVVPHEQQEFNIHFTLSGTPQDPKPDYWSEPYLSKVDILELLSLGTTSTDLERTGGTTALWGGIADKVVRATGIGSQLSKLLPGNTIFKNFNAHVSSDYIEQTGTVEPVGQVDLNVVNDNWTMRAQSSLLGPRGRKAEIDAKLRKSVDAQLQWDGDKPSAPSYGDFGGDFRWHWEKQ